MEIPSQLPLPIETYRTLPDRIERHSKKISAVTGRVPIFTFGNHTSFINRTALQLPSRTIGEAA